jgi:hypothetical protein
MHFPPTYPDVATAVLAFQQDTFAGITPMQQISMQTAIMPQQQPAISPFMLIAIGVAAWFIWGQTK